MTQVSWEEAGLEGMVFSQEGGARYGQTLSFSGGGEGALTARNSSNMPAGFFRTSKIAFLNSSMPAGAFSYLKNSISEQ